MRYHVIIVVSDVEFEWVETFGHQISEPWRSTSGAFEEFASK